MSSCAFRTLTLEAASGLPRPGWLAWEPGGVPAEPEVIPERTHNTKTSCGQATRVDSKANQPGLPRQGSRDLCDTSGGVFEVILHTQKLTASKKSWRDRDSWHQECESYSCLTSIHTDSPFPPGVGGERQDISRIRSPPPITLKSFEKGTRQPHTVPIQIVQ